MTHEHPVRHLIESDFPELQNVTMRAVRKVFQSALQFLSHHEIEDMRDEVLMQVYETMIDKPPEEFMGLNADEFRGRFYGYCTNKCRNLKRKRRIRHSHDLSLYSDEHGGSDTVTQVEDSPEVHLIQTRLAQKLNAFRTSLGQKDRSAYDALIAQSAGASWAEIHQNHQEHYSNPDSLKKAVSRMRKRLHKMIPR